MAKKLLKVKATKKSIEAKPTSIEQIEKKQPVIWATGKRKTAVAQIKLAPNGQGQIFINNRNLEEYFPYFEWQDIVKQPLILTNLENKIDLFIKLNGGGVKAQAEAVRLGISRAIVKFNPEFRKILKSEGFLRRDARIKERKKPGLKRARRAPQWQKR
ncbi:MAG: 30S ribosomal protein S9 [Patescibacteria group bacterium]